MAPSSRPSPQRERLVALAQRFAREVHEISPPDALGERVDYVIWGRKRGWEQVEGGEMSELELRGLLLDHLDYECADVSGRSMIELASGDLARASEIEALVEDLDLALFGHGAKN